MSNNLKISVGIPAYNEEANIGYLISNILSQEFSNDFALLEIIVVSDGSTDSTANIVSSISDKRVRLINGIIRTGKNTRINEILKEFNGDVLVLLDADIALSNKKLIQTIAKPFTLYKKIGLVAGNAQPLPAKTLAATAFNNYVESLNFIKKRINRGQNVYSVRGPILALSKSFAKNLSIPTGVPDDRYIYFACLKGKFKFWYEENSKVFFKSPTTIDEQIGQGMRFIGDRNGLFKNLNPEILNKEYYIPVYLKILGLILQISKNPVAYLVMKYIQVRVVTSRKSETSTWRVIKTSKNLT